MDDTEPAPDDLLVLVDCCCHTGCSSRRCSCVLSEGMPCTDACGCEDSDNQTASCRRETDSEGSDDEAEF